MHRLGGGHEVHGAIVETAGLGRCDAVRHAGVRRRVRDLCLARVGRDDVGEVARQAHRGLAGSRGAVPGRVARGRYIGEEVEERIGVARAERRVAR